jgi:hypothetical protein
MGPLQVRHREPHPAAPEQVEEIILEGRVQAGKAGRDPTFSNCWRALLRSR